jgi:hypothetical protein
MVTAVSERRRCGWPGRGKSREHVEGLCIDAQEGLPEGFGLGQKGRWRLRQPERKQRPKGTWQRPERRHRP